MFSFATKGSGLQNLIYVGGTTATLTATSSTSSVAINSLTGGVSSAPAENDIVVVGYGIGAGSDLNVDVSGYSEIADLYANDTYDTNLGVFYKVMTSSPDTSITVSQTGGLATSGAVAVQVWRNVNTATPIDVTSTTTTQLSTVLANPPAITPVSTNAVIIAIGAGAHNAGAQTYSSSDLSNFLTTGANSNGVDATIGMGSYLWTSGEFNPAAFTFSTSNNNDFSCAAVTLALRPN